MLEKRLIMQPAIRETNEKPDDKEGILKKQLKAD